MKKSLIITLLITISLFSSPFKVLSIEEQSFSWEDKIIALDAGHGGDYLGATYPPNEGDGAEVYEKDVNLAVVYALKQKLESVGAKVVLTRKCDETISSRKARVGIALDECKTLGHKCDILVSVHHNGNTSTTHNGTMVIYNEKQDIPLAEVLLEFLVPLTEDSEGLDHGGYGMTVYGHLVSVITEAYYITNTQEAERYLQGTSTRDCINEDNTNYSVFTGNRVIEEANALFRGLFNYFDSSSGNGGVGLF